ncbi:hypothetical protein DEO72_LG10g2424 [Vigna unguiculata]|uniref:Uncharacterized protein n=1 Tax=Vigna unguiculata TaxID=3917 RepID=A0A4D6NE99_VIGUN|nr:hypothetical protein DEO72_LG10g2424 [Vigna unguiculata]
MPEASTRTKGCSTFALLHLRCNSYCLCATPEVAATSSRENVMCMRGDGGTGEKVKDDIGIRGWVEMGSFNGQTKCCSGNGGKVL